MQVEKKTIAVDIQIGKRKPTEFIPCVETLISDIEECCDVEMLSSDIDECCDIEMLSSGVSECCDDRG